MDKQTALDIVNASMGRELCDLVIKGANVVDVYSGNTFISDVYIKDGYIAGFTGDRKAKKEIDANGKYLVPGLIDGHCHIESSHLSP